MKKDRAKEDLDYAEKVTKEFANRVETIIAIQSKTGSINSFFKVKGFSVDAEKEILDESYLKSKMKRLERMIKGDSFSLSDSLIWLREITGIGLDYYFFGQEESLETDTKKELAKLNEVGLAEYKRKKMLESKLPKKKKALKEEFKRILGEEPFAFFGIFSNVILNEISSDNQVFVKRLKNLLNNYLEEWEQNTNETPSILFNYGLSIASNEMVSHIGLEDYLYGSRIKALRLTENGTSKEKKGIGINTFTKRYGFNPYRTEKGKQSLTKDQEQQLINKSGVSGKFILEGSLPDNIEKDNRTLDAYIEWLKIINEDIDINILIENTEKEIDQFVDKLEGDKIYDWLNFIENKFESYKPFLEEI